VLGTYALSRGVGLERLVDPEATPLDRFEEMFMAYVTGAIRPRAGAAATDEP